MEGEREGPAGRSFFAPYICEEKNTNLDREDRLKRVNELSKSFEANSMKSSLSIYLYI